MIVIGLCGGSGGGKSTVAGSFEKYGVPSVNTDQVYKHLTSYRSKCMEELIGAFGACISLSDGSLDKAAMRELVFASENCDEKRALLNNITHKHILNDVKMKIAQYEVQGKKAITLDVPLMYESGFDSLCNYMIGVTASIDLRLKRIMLRDAITKAQAIARIESQMSDSQIMERADFIIRNDCDVSVIDTAVHDIILKLAL